MKKSNIKSKIRREQLNPIFQLKDKPEEDDKVLTKAIIHNALKSGKLVLSSKHLKTIPEKIYFINEEQNESNPNVFNFDQKLKDEDLWWNRVNLHYLDLSSNCLTEISSDVQNLMDLSVLNVSCNNH
jgi:hypothetical protein